MSKAPRIQDYLEHMLSAIDRINRHIAGVDRPKFLASELIQDAVIRNLEIIGEAANNIQRVDPEFATKNADIPWKVMYAMRNRLSHGYEKVDNEMVWNTVCEDLPALQSQVKKVSNQIMD